MIQGILQLLEYANGETENIKIAQGKYELPTTFKKGIEQIKNEIKWQKKL